MADEKFLSTSTSVMGLVQYDRNHKMLGVEWELQPLERAGFVGSVVFEDP
jgi:hypothetical protein